MLREVKDSKGCATGIAFFVGCGLTTTHLFLLADIVDDRLYVWRHVPLMSWGAWWLISKQVLEAGQEGRAQHTQLRPPACVGGSEGGGLR